MMGLIPVEIGELKKLEELTFANNLFEGEIPNQLNLLKNLKVLLLNNNNFIGKLNSSIKMLPKLTVLEYTEMAQINPKSISVNKSTPITQTTLTPL